jgi:prophage regulatory protein
MLIDCDSLDQPKHARIIRLPEMIQRVGFGKTKIYDLIKKGQFPGQAKMLIGSRTAGWYEDEIDVYVESGRNNRKRLRRAVLTHTGGSCDCGRSCPQICKWTRPV